ncbi:MAG: bifunctional 4-hydroxy-3-methylbut-2-enyl diphosphate reductase/30S ribosomal protein S1 [Defluviitaleaceae bacterium]|nr:bifunctional 4-hydroxy-3-methylbut-2-enyl diphosphate reductase/30S ribosomal protein S1 [Defluviitaleaceae bacterium]
MKIIIAEHLGFCAGVAQAVDTAYEMADSIAVSSDTEKKCATLGPLIHNRLVTDDLAQKGIGILDSLDRWQGEELIIRAHGISPFIEQELINRNIPYVDRTCPHVKTIHRKAEESKNQKRTLIVLGQRDHPEIMGIIGYAGDDIIIAENTEDLYGLSPLRKYTLVVQTTYNREDYEQKVSLLKDCGLDVIIYDTICDATTKRQQEAERLSKIVDIMLVLGDPDSANSKKLCEICNKYCKSTFFGRNIHDIQLQDLSINDTIGITAGASTPPAVIKEALLVMSMLEKNMESAATKEEALSGQSFEDMLNESFVTLHTGDVVKGTVIQVTNSEITVNLGYKSDGTITRNEFTDDSNADLQDLAKPGDVIEVLVMRVNDGDGNVLVSKRRLDAQTNSKLIEQAFNEKSVVKGRILDLVKGGLIASIFGNRVFVPSSQISNRYVEDLSEFKGKEFNFNILEFDRSKKRIVAGRRDLAAQEQKALREELFASLEVGQKLEGSVSRITDFGAFVDLNGADGLVHISELAWRRVRKVSDVLAVGDKVTVTVIEINQEKSKISLTLKDIDNNPWNNVMDRYPVDSIVEGKVVRMAAFGAFVSLEDGVDGLVHVSQIAHHHVAKPEDELSVGQAITVKVTDIDIENRKIGLSKKLTEAPPENLEGEDKPVDSAEKVCAEEAPPEEINATKEVNNAEEVVSETEKEAASEA